MIEKFSTVEEYVQSLDGPFADGIKQLRMVINLNIPSGFKEEMNYGMIGWVVPHAIYPQGYHCNPTLPLPFINLAAQKNFIALYHMGLYADPELSSWFTNEFIAVTGSKPDMGKSCIRFKKIGKIPFDLIGKLVSKVTIEQWIITYETNYKR